MRKVLVIVAIGLLLLVWAEFRMVTVEGEAYLEKKPMAGATVFLAGETPLVGKDGKFTVRIRPGVYPVSVDYRARTYKLDTTPDSGVHIGWSFIPQGLSLWLTAKDEINRR